MNDTHQLPPAWHFPFAQTFPVPNSDGAGRIFETTYKNGDRKDILGMGIGRWPASDINGKYSNFQIRAGKYDDPDITYDGIQIRGRAVLDNVTVAGVGGLRRMNREAFGIRSSNQDPSGRGQGGVIIRNASVIGSDGADYTTGICIGTWDHQNAQPSSVDHCDVTLPWGDHAGLTATLNTTFTDTVVSGPCYDLYIDTLPARGVINQGGRATICKAAVSLVAKDKEPKRHIIIKDRVFYFQRRKGHAFYALELMQEKDAKSPDGGLLFDDITFENCYFIVPDNEPFYLISTNYQGAPNIRFHGVIPRNARLYAKEEPMLDNAFINGSPARKVITQR